MYMRENEEMSEAGKAARAAYMREYRRRNPDKMREYERRRWEKKATLLMANNEERTENE